MLLQLRCRAPALHFNSCRGTCWYRFAIRNSVRVFFMEHNLHASAPTCPTPAAVLGTSFRCWWSRFCRGRCRWAWHCFEQFGNCSRNDCRQAGTFELFLLLWGVLPVVFFSLSELKPAGVHLPAIPAFGLMLADYLWQKQKHARRVPAAVVVMHCLLDGTC